jgi:hypothetical protein
LLQALTRKGHEFVPVPDESFLVRKVVGVHGTWFTFVDALEAEGLVLCTSFLPVRAVGERGRDVLNLILHLNGGLQVGRFDVGGVEDRVVFQMAVRVEQFRRGAEIVASAVSSHLAFVEIHIPLFKSVERGVSTVSEAVDVLLGWMTDGESGEEDWLFPCFGRN